jgi:hypothetical protein
MDLDFLGSTRELLAGTGGDLACSSKQRLARSRLD